MDLKSYIIITYLCTMIFGEKIPRARKTSTLVLFLYILLYFCIAFHFHPVNLETNTQHYLHASAEENQISGTSIHCEVCHIGNNFYQIVYPTYNESKIILPGINFSVTLISHLTKLSEITHNLRAPPTV